MKTIRFIFLTIFSGLAFLTCNQANDVPGCEAVSPSPDCVCYEIYAPVCGCDGVTYSNDCYAECHGIFDYEPGKCEED
ncbi:MAG: hypothetical protein J5I94_09895 [Phaeodactylibacter sp.]|nr:hypothetical protein [Phaeodactylibacter sp.]